MAEFISLYSGSSGNSSVVRCGSRYLIVDMGKGVRTTSAALKALVQKSQGGKFGARDLRRVIRKAVEDPAAERLIDGTLASGGTLVVDAGENGEVVLK